MKRCSFLIKLLVLIIAIPIAIFIFVIKLADNYK